MSQIIQKARQSTAQAPVKRERQQTDQHNDQPAQGQGPERTTIGRVVDRISLQPQGLVQRLRRLVQLAVQYLLCLGLTNTVHRALPPGQRLDGL